jgi:methionyl-tRNA formyltransferase
MKKEKRNLIFIGSSDFGLPSLNALAQDKNFNVISVITQPDKKSGRGQMMSFNPIKKTAVNLDIPVLQPVKISKIETEIKKLNPDIIIVIAYAQLIPLKILNIPKYGCLNVHGSLLPKYRGASCIQEAILKGDKESGITFMLMDEGLDTGPIIKSIATPINNSDTTGIIFDKLALLSAEKLAQILKDYISKKNISTAQDNNKSSYVKTLSKKDGQINWKKPALEIERFIRAMTPWPSAFSYLDSKMIKILKTSPEITSINKYKPGEIFSENKKLFIQCGKNSLEVLEIQLEGGKKLSALEFINGHKNLINKILK